jgi:hypothetical protein
MQASPGIVSLAMQSVGSPGGAEMDRDDEGFLYGCVKQTVQSSLLEGKLTILWHRGKRRSTLRYHHTSVHHFTDEKPESIRLKGLYDEAVIEGENLDPIKTMLDEEKVAVLRESASTDVADGGQPVVFKIQVRDRL